MNIFMVDSDPRTAARMLCNAHVRSQIKEAAMMLSTSHHQYGTTLTDIYDPSFVHHPCTKWVCENAHHYVWLAKHADELCKEYKLRHGVSHYLKPMIDKLFPTPVGMPTVNARNMFPVVSNDLKPDLDEDEPLTMNDVVTAYRKYYNRDKRHLHYWMVRDKPKWITNDKKTG